MESKLRTILQPLGVEVLVSRQEVMGYGLHLVLPDGWSPVCGLDALIWQMGRRLGRIFEAAAAGRLLEAALGGGAHLPGVRALLAALCPPASSEVPAPASWQHWRFLSFAAFEELKALGLQLAEQVSMPAQAATIAHNTRLRTRSGTPVPEQRAPKRRGRWSAQV